jgi:N-acetylmuramoyl-L-alanine amidase
MRRFPSPRTFGLAAVLAIAMAAIPTPAPALGPPATLDATRPFGNLAGAKPPVDPGFATDYLAVSWLHGEPPQVRFRSEEGWSTWRRVEIDDIQTGSRTFGALISAAGAGGYQVRGDAAGVRAMAINTTDGPRDLTWERPEAEAGHLAQPTVITRAVWGADENLRFNGANERCTRTFYPTQKLIVHHTVTANNDPDPAATIRAIYHDHVVNRDFCDIAYNFLLDAQGRLYKGRYSGPHNTKTQDTVTGENSAGLGVTGAHTGGYNSGTMGIALLGNYVSTPISSAAHQTLVQHLAWEAERHLLPPTATSRYTNPESGATRVTANIAGHRDYTATACPGEAFYQTLAAVRQEVAALVGGLPPPDRKPPRISGIKDKNVTRRAVAVRWRTSEPATGRVQYWEAGHRRRMTKPEASLRRTHKSIVRGLPTGTSFRYRVFSTDDAGNAAWSRPKRFVT